MRRVCHRACQRDRRRAGTFLQVATAPPTRPTGDDFRRHHGGRWCLLRHQVRSQNAATTSADEHRGGDDPLAAPRLTLAVGVVPASVTLAWADNRCRRRPTLRCVRDGVLIATLPAGSAADTTVLDGAATATSWLRPMRPVRRRRPRRRRRWPWPRRAARPAVTGNAPLTVSVGWVDNSVSETGYTSNAPPTRPSRLAWSRSRRPPARAAMPTPPCWPAAPTTTAYRR